ncbi:serine/threonine-protein kinase [Nocardioides sp. 616]|uniref:serine/threonine-protein kinase n=1 Tax=Nocardioides sp. 616 TaxID=2268090 RepID=UPI0023DD0D31|nr:serine/threonine-protein kinase [Nocardioides sp. 616]
MGSGPRLGGWVLGEQLGAGGMGTVFRARRDGRVAAVKVVHPGLAADEEFRLRFRREVDIASRVTGRHVAAVIDAGPDDPTPWMATELVDGITLSRHVSVHGPLTGDELTVLVEGTAHGLAQLHAAGVIHRDVKPSNVMLGPEGPVLLDFGVAAAADLTSMTATGHRLGSAGWMSPEQVEGRPVTGRTDVFSWALTVSYAAAGRNPYGTGPGEALLYRVVHAHPDLDGLPPRWQPLLAWCLAGRPQDRPSSSQLLDLIRHPDLVPVEAPTEASDTRSLMTRIETPAATPTQSAGSRWWRGLAAALAAASVVAAVAGTGWWWSQPAPQTPTTASAVPAADADAAERIDPDSGSGRPARGHAVSPSAPVAGEPQDSTAPDFEEEELDQPPALLDMFNAGSRRHMSRVGKFFTTHVHRQVVVDMDWWAGQNGYLSGSEDGMLVAQRGCFPICPGTFVQSVQLELDDPHHPDVTYVGVRNNWRVGGTFFVRSAVDEGGGRYAIKLRVADVPDPEPPTPSSTGRCDVLDSVYLPYPGRPLSSTGGKEFDPHVVVVQDLLNFQGTVVDGIGCVDEDGYFGPATKDAVRAFQRHGGAKVDGVVGQDTWAALMLTFE